jgi:cell division protein FtsL
MSAFDRLIPRPLSRPRPLSQPLSLRPLLLGAFLVIALVGLLQVIQTSDVTTTGYSLRSLEQDRLGRQAQVHQLEAEVAALTSMDRIEREARGRLGMVTPAETMTLEVHTQPPAQQLIPQRYVPEEVKPAPKADSWLHKLLRLLPF